MPWPSRDRPRSDRARVLRAYLGPELLRVEERGERRVVFTGGGSEADNLAINGVALAGGRTSGHLVTSAIEHPAVLEAAVVAGAVGGYVIYKGMVDDWQVAHTTYQVDDAWQATLAVLDDISDEDMQEIVMTYNLTPRKCLGYITPIQTLFKDLGRDVRLRFA